MAQTQDTVLLRDAVAAAKAGNKAQARQLLRQASVHNPNNELVWLWRASLSESPKEATFYLGEVLRVNPNNQKAAAWLARCKGQGAGEPRLAATVMVPPPMGAPANGERAAEGVRQGALRTEHIPGSIRPAAPPPRPPAASPMPAGPSGRQPEHFSPVPPGRGPVTGAPPAAATPFPGMRTPAPSVKTPFPSPQPPAPSAPMANSPFPPRQAPHAVLSPLPGLRPDLAARPMAPAPPPPAPKWLCPFCGYSSESAHRRCPTCKAITVLEDLREV
jgi:hypothetical protein